MKKINFLPWVFYLCILFVLSESCKSDNDSCTFINCNAGSFNQETCSCDCPIGYIGTSCENFDPNQIQALLDAGITPIELYNGDISLNDLYGNTYQGGLIFYLNTTDGTGLVAALQDQSTGAKWGCFGTDISGLDNNVTSQPSNLETEIGARIGDGNTNTDAILAECTEDDIAAKLCRDLGQDWFLPSREELNLMYTNLHAKNLGNFADEWYYSSSEFDASSAWFHDFSNGDQLSADRIFDNYVRATKAF